ncbi:SRS domain-containing protein [Neospora caninum Liverpool]|uniref:SRS domain-containing protein n=1 Tax=Neospora caninum (strain Liverpool) TaxID=572307 RepID=F0VL92_NEOCL|nr:SRS domain-containing protein [Neospora caninum Liverpool]CBZ54844.1 SRS domain-containing protein [Neospora caninum Liverpool]CEL69563.1 TPA: SRS domain-containing protein [Neospora caninum Liverpool]|eukprot:XP_003884872.1 SRS domain-containing protein [Neospora caninum Liverpool]
MALRTFVVISVASFFLKPTSSYASEAGSPAAVQGVKSCDSEPEGEAVSEIHLTLSPGVDSVSFICSAKENAVLKPSTTKVFVDQGCDRSETLDSLFAGATLEENTAGDSKKSYTLKIPPVTRQIQKLLYYKCSFTTAVQPLLGDQGPSVSTKDCKVIITVEKVEQTEPPPDSNDQQQPQTAPESTDEQQTDLVECDSTATTKEAGVSAESPHSFKCGAGMSLHPTNLTDVFDDQDGKCAAEVALQTLVDATLTKTETEATHNGQPVYQLAVKTAPSEDTALCYKCVTTSSNLETKTNTDEASAAKECLLKISVKGSASSAFSSTWGAAKTAIAFFVTVPPVLGVVDI